MAFPTFIPEIDYQIILNLDDRSLGRVCQENRYLATLCADPWLWITKLTRRGWAQFLRIRQDPQALYRLLSTAVYLDLKEQWIGAKSPGQIVFIGQTVPITPSLEIITGPALNERNGNFVIYYVRGRNGPLVGVEPFGSNIFHRLEMLEEIEQLQSAFIKPFGKIRGWNLQWLGYNFWILYGEVIYLVWKNRFVRGPLDIRGDHPLEYQIKRYLEGTKLEWRPLSEFDPAMR